MAGTRKRGEKLEALARELQRLNVETVLVNQAIADRHGLNLTDYQIRSILELEGPLTAGRLAELSGLTTGAITGVVDRLERAALAERATDPDDRRRVIIRPTRSRAKDAPDFLAELSDALADSLEGLDEPGLDAVLGFVHRANDGLVRARARLRGPAEKPATPEGLFSAPLGRVKEGRLEFAHGAAHVRLDADPDLGDLYRARFEGPLPSLDVDGGHVVVRYRRPSLAEIARWAFGGGKHESRLTLNGSIPWQVDMKAGLARLVADFSRVRLTGLTIAGGASDVQVTLPEPHGVVPVRVSGGASNVGLHRPRGTHARIQLTGGASGLRFDDQHLGSAGGDVSLETPGAKHAPNRYEIRLSGGASAFVVDSR